jgi:2-methylaconitate isomerase
MGSPDPTSLQIDGMGGGITSTSKVALISKILKRETPFLNYNFGQVSIKEKKIDWSGNCGNLASGLFEYAKNEKDYEDCFEKVNESNSKYTHKLRVWQENKKHEMYIWGNLSSSPEKVIISGVQSAYPPLFVEFKDIIPPGSKLFPTGNTIDKLLLSENDVIEATLISGANPLVIINASSLNLEGNELPSQINYQTMKPRLDTICQKASEKMGIELTDAVRVAWVASPLSYTDTSNNLIEKEKINILSRITANSRIHHAHTGTGAINIAISGIIKGTIPNLLIKYNKLKEEQNQIKEKINSQKIEGEVVIGHPGGLMICEAEVENMEKEWNVNRAGFVRHARILMEGWVYF